MRRPFLDILMTTYTEKVIHFVALKIYAAIKESLVFQFNFSSIPYVFFYPSRILRKVSVLDIRISDCSIGLAFLTAIRKQNFL